MYKNFSVNYFLITTLMIKWRENGNVQNKKEYLASYRGKEKNNNLAKLYCSDLLKIKMKIFTVLKRYRRKIHELACELFGYEASLPPLHISKGNSPMWNYDGKIFLDPTLMKKDFKIFKSFLSRSKIPFRPTFEEHIIYYLEEENSHYVHLALNPTIEKLDFYLILQMSKKYLDNKIKKGDELWTAFVLNRGYLEGIAKGGRALIRDKIDFPREEYDELFGSNFLSFLRKNLTNEIYLDFVGISLVISEVIGRKLAMKMKEWSEKKFRALATKKRYELSREDFKLLEEVIEDLGRGKLNRAFPIVRRRYITQLRKGISLIHSVKTLYKPKVWYKF